MDTSNHVLVASLGASDCAHAVVQTTRTHSTLHDFEAATFSKNDIGAWNSDVVEEDFAMTLWSIVKAKDCQCPLDSNTRAVPWDKNDAVALRFVRILWIGASKDNEANEG